ncbi:hypothetical protein [Bacillus sp. SJS]|uniref:hypothetical protein n=1 Tax=Bacillus sp. SJS TaxID=1423321 RepID=UPI000A865DE5|nr:hypothetical protein [Bacillus sp. SJS]
MATIIYLEDNGEISVITEIKNIVQLGKEGDSDARTLARYIRQGLTQLEAVGIPAEKRLEMYGYEDNGDERFFNLLKPLRGPKPLYEFRVNRSTPGAFRAIFFEYNFEGEQYLIFTKAVLKKGDSNPPEFQTAMRESERLYQDFFKDPSKYLEEGE